MQACLEETKAKLSAIDAIHPEELWKITNPFFEGNPFAQCALDMAAWDLYAKQQGKNCLNCLTLTLKTYP